MFHLYKQKKSGKKKWNAFNESAREDSGIDVIQWIKKCQDLGAGELLITSVDKDGTENGYDLELAEEISKNTSLPIIFSGGFGSFKDILELDKLKKIDAYCIGSSLHKNISEIKKIKFLARKNNIEVR